MHYGLLPRANRGIFAINELPDLASKVQVGLFNILQEGDVQIKGYPVRLRLDVLLVFSANPEDYTARGKIITPLKDRIGSEIRTHYPRSRQDAMAITAQEAWVGPVGDAGRPLPVEVPAFVREIVEEIAFHARADQKVDKRSGVSQRLPITHARERRLERRAAGARRRRGARRAARERHLRLAAVAHRQDRARVRRRAQGRRHRGARARPAGGRDRVRRPRGARSTRGRSSSGSSAAARSSCPTRRRRPNCWWHVGARSRASTAVAGARHPRPRLASRCAPRSRTSCSRASARSKKISRTDEGRLFGTPRRRSTGPEPAAVGDRWPRTTRRPFGAARRSTTDTTDMKYRYSKFVEDLLDEVDFESLVPQLSDLLLSSGFNNPWDPQSDDDRTMQALHDAILDALLNGGVLSEEMLKRLLVGRDRPEPRAATEARAATSATRSKQLVQQIIERLTEQGYVSVTGQPESQQLRRRRRRDGPGRSGRRVRGHRQGDRLSRLPRAARPARIDGPQQRRPSRHARAGDRHRGRRPAAAVRVRRHAESRRGGDRAERRAARRASAATRRGRGTAPRAAWTSTTKT